ncbi:hypothetical protein ACFYT4_27500 [Streptomyces sp. NPDC004609]|uniref:hypothetical protein n=1 Tax=Streptomyces sp. NPDC004609 TaxID=3364704 RepID=UPI003687A770
MNPLHLAGWLFADMLLVVALVAMGDQGDPLGAARAAEPRPGASGKATAPPKKSGKKPSGPRAVEHRPVEVAIDANASDSRRIIARLRAVTAKYQGRQAAIVLTFGRNQDAGAGVAYARRVNSLLDEARPEMFRGTTTRDFVLLRGSSGHADLEIYFYTH